MRQTKGFALFLLTLLAAALLALPALAAENPGTGGNAVAEAPAAPGAAQSTTISGKAIASGIAIGIAAAGGALGMGLATGKASESIARQPEAEGKIRTGLMLGLVFIETAIIYALLTVILIIFVL